ncbi:MAG: SsrA-binding protein SmpB [Nitrospirota bacterium]
MVEKVICSNRKARYEYEILETFEAGISLKGTEVKSLRNSQANLTDSLARVEKGEVFLFNCHISQYPFGNIANHEPTRVRKLLLKRQEINRLIGKTQEKGLTLIPLRIYFKRGKAKVELGLAKGKKLYDKREVIKKREHDQEIRRAMKEVMR